MTGGRYYDTPVGKLPSVTTIISIIHKPWLTAWALKEARESIYKSFKLLQKEKLLNSLTDEELINIIKESSKTYEDKAKVASDIGSLLHGCIEFYYKELLPESYPKSTFVKDIRFLYNELLASMVEKAFDHIDKTISMQCLSEEALLVGVYSEKAVYSEKGYAGTADLILHFRTFQEYKELDYLILIDLKTTNRDRYKGGIPKDHKMQLSAYAESIEEHYNDIIPIKIKYKKYPNVIKCSYILRIDKVKPELSEIFPLGNTFDSLSSDLSAFYAALQLYKYTKGE